MTMRIECPRRLPSGPPRAGLPFALVLAKSGVDTRRERRDENGDKEPTRCQMALSISFLLTSLLAISLFQALEGSTAAA